MKGVVAHNRRGKAGGLRKAYSRSAPCGLSVLTRLAAAWLISFILLPFNAKAAAPLDSLGRLLNAYTKTLEGYSAEFKARECDGLIAFCSDSLTRNYTARTLYKHYAESPLMNDEAVAVHLYDTWFSSRPSDAEGSARNGGAPLHFNTSDEALQAQLFTSLNRGTLLGMTPPDLTLSDEEGNFIVIPDAPRAYILFFYSTECATCKLYTKQLESVISHATEPLDLYFIYTGTDREAWDQWRRERLSWNLSEMNATGGPAGPRPLEYFTTPPRIRLFHLWDPYHDSDFPASYGVVSTPRLFFVDENNRIAGRRLDPESLQTLLQKRDLSRNYAYGSEESLSLFASMLPEGGMDESSVEEVLASVKQAGKERGDPDLYRHLTGDLLYYLSSRNSEEGIAACDRLIRYHILSDEIAWTGATDTLSVLQLARFLQNLHGKAAVGSKVPAVKAYVLQLKPDSVIEASDLTAPAATPSASVTPVSGSSASVTPEQTGSPSDDLSAPVADARHSRPKESLTRLDRLKKGCCLHPRETILLFYDPSCADCKQQIARARALAAEKDAPLIYLINVEDNLSRLSETEKDALMDAFDLSSLPYLIQLDKKGFVTRRYFKLDDK